jgi:hypothetical protein
MSLNAIARPGALTPVLIRTTTAGKRYGTLAQLIIGQPGAFESQRCALKVEECRQGRSLIRFMGRLIALRSHMVMIRIAPEVKKRSSTAAKKGFWHPCCSN